jgi:predicted Zn-dependent peptidase
MGVSSLDNDRYKYSIISNILSGNMSSRLFQKIREERGLAYSVYGYMSSFEEGGLFTVYAGTTSEDYKEVMKLVYDEFKEIRENGVLKKELERAKNQFLSSMTFGLEHSVARMSRMANSYLTFGEIRTVEDILEGIEKITCDDIKEVAQIMFDERYFSSTVMGDI